MTGIPYYLSVAAIKAAAPQALLTLLESVRPAA